MSPSFPPPPLAPEQPTTVPAALRKANILAMSALTTSGDEAESLFAEAGRCLSLAWYLSRVAPVPE